MCPLRRQFKCCRVLREAGDVVIARIIVPCWKLLVTVIHVRWLSAIMVHTCGPSSILSTVHVMTGVYAVPFSLYSSVTESGTANVTWGLSVCESYADALSTPGTSDRLTRCMQQCNKHSRANLSSTHSLMRVYASRRDHKVTLRPPITGSLPAGWDTRVMSVGNTAGSSGSPVRAEGHRNALTLNSAGLLYRLPLRVTQS